MIPILLVQLTWGILAFLLVLQPEWCNIFVLMMVTMCGPTAGAMAVLLQRRGIDLLEEVEHYLDELEHTDHNTVVLHQQWIDTNGNQIQLYKGKYIAVDVLENKVVVAHPDYTVFTKMLSTHAPDYVRQLLRFHADLFLDGGK